MIFKTTICKDLKMKRVLFFLMLGCLACNQPTEVPKHGIKDILDATPLLKVSNSSVKPDHLYEILVFHGSVIRKGKKEQVYALSAYFPNNKDAGCGIGSLEFYDKVQYKWTNDTVLEFKLFNSSNSFSESCTLISYSNGTISVQKDSINGIPIDSISH